MDNHNDPNPWEAPQTRDPRPERQPQQNRERRPATFDTAVSIAKELWAEHRTTLLTAWGVVAGLSIFSSLVMGVAGVALGMDPASQQETIKNISAGQAGPFSMFGPGYWGFIGIAFVLGILQVGVSIGTFAPVRTAWRDGTNLSGGDVVSMIGGRVLPGAVLYFVFTIAVAIGGVLCLLPGLAAAYFMMPSFYLVGGRGDGVFDAIGTAYEWGKRHVGLQIILIVISVAILFSIGCVSGMASNVLMTTGKAGYIVGQLVSSVFGAIIGFFIWVLYTATMLTIEQEEEGSGWQSDW